MIGISDNGTPKSPNIPIIIITTTLVIVIGVAADLSLNNSNESQHPEAPSSSQPTSPSLTLPSLTSSTSANKTTITATATSESPETSSGASGTSDTSASSSSSTLNTTSSSSMTTNSELASALEGQNFSTGRSNLGSLGFANNSTRYDSGDRTFIVTAAEQRIEAAACETCSDEKCYRSDTPRGSGSMGIVVDEGDRVVIQDGSYRYQMSPDGVLVAKDNEVVRKYATEAWGTA